MHPTDVASSDVDSAGNSTKEKIMTTTLTNPLEEDTLSQARAEAREILKNLSLIHISEPTRPY